METEKETGVGGGEGYVYTTVNHRSFRGSLQKGQVVRGGARKIVWFFRWFRVLGKITLERRV